MVEFDCYKALDQKRCLELDTDRLSEKFQELSKLHHPDAGGDETNFSKINKAHSILLNPSSRVEHLYQLLFNESIRSDGPMSTNVMSLFSEISELITHADMIIKKKEKSLSLVGEALMAKDISKLQSQLFEASGRVRNAKLGVLEFFSEIDQLIQTDHVDTKKVMEQASRDLSFLGKWEREIMGRMHSVI